MFQELEIFMQMKYYFIVKLILKKCKKINKNQTIKLLKNSKFVLNLAIKLGGSSIRDFKNISGKSGLFQNEFKVYGRENKNCIKRKL